MEKDIIKSKAINTLRKIPLFHGLQEDEYRELLGVCRLSRYDKGEVIFEQGEASYHMYVLLSGSVMIKGKNNNTFSLQPGEVLGEIGLVCNVKRTASAVATDDVILLEIDKEDVDLMQGKNPHISAVVMKNIANTLAQRLLKATGYSADFIL